FNRVPVTTALYCACWSGLQIVIQTYAISTEEIHILRPRLIHENFPNFSVRMEISSRAQH
ncbi:MAG: hypothetical protein VW124_23685, partial [Paracoccaceae bacterium]